MKTIKNQEQEEMNRKFHIKLHNFIICVVVFIVVVDFGYVCGAHSLHLVCIQIRYDLVLIINTIQSVSWKFLTLTHTHTH